MVAQPFSAGIKAGVPLTDFLDAAEGGNIGDMFEYTSTTARYIVGGTAELRLPLSFGVEFDALYRHLSYSSVEATVPASITGSTTGSDWEFPLLLKYRFHFPVVRPFLDAGVAWDTLAGLHQSLASISAIPVPGTTSTSTTSSPRELKQNTTMGFVVGGGVDIHAIVLHISQEIRFTRWNSSQINASSGLLHSNLNQAEFLVGFTF